MKKIIRQKAIYRSVSAKFKDNVICYVRMEVVLCL